MDTKLRRLMLELEYRNKKLDELQDIHMQSIREEMEFGHFDQGISEYYKSAIKAAESSIEAIQAKIDSIEDNEEFFSRFGKKLHDLYKKDTPGFDKFTRLEDAVTSYSSWNYIVPGEPIDLLANSTPSAIVPVSALPKTKTAQFVTYKNKSLYIFLAFAPEINTVFVRR